VEPYGGTYVNYTLSGVSSTQNQTTKQVLISLNDKHQHNALRTQQ